MRRFKLMNIFLCASLLILTAGCATVGGPSDPIHQTTLMTEIISDPPGAKIEINDEYVGETPLTIHIKRIYASDGYGGGSWGIVQIKANPVLAGQYVQVKIIMVDQPTPKKMYFDMRLGPVAPQLNLNVNE